MTTTSKVYGDYLVFVESKALRGRSKQEPSRGDGSEIDCAKRSPKGAAAGRRGRQYLRQVRKLGMRHPERSLKQISERMVFDHLIHLRDKEKLRPSTLNQAVVALRIQISRIIADYG